ncbi:MAG: PilZ domain-containing protein [Acidobacteriota bacterium]
MPNPPTQRRRFPRISSENAVLVKRLTTGSDEGFAKTRDMGLGGCAFVNPDPVGVGSEVELFIAVKLHVVHVRGRVVYEAPAAEGGGVEVGVEFADLSEPDRDVLGALAGPEAPDAS